MQIITEKRCIIGEGPIWNKSERKLCFTNGMANEICKLDIYTGELTVRKLGIGVAAMAFNEKNRLIVSRSDGVFILNDDDTTENLYDTDKFEIKFGNDMKVGPDGRIYVGTQSGKRKGVSDKVDGKLCSIDKNSNVKVLLDNLKLSNGLEWSMDEKRLYHTDSDTGIIKEYEFDSDSGDIAYTGRCVKVPGADGFTIDENDNLYVACWGQGHIAVVDTRAMTVSDYISLPAAIPASCAFCGDDMDILAVTTASYSRGMCDDTNDGYTILLKTKMKGRTPYLFG